MALAVDGKVITTASVSATSWTNYPAATTIPAGNHTVAIGYTNDFRGSSCDRNLLLDTVTVVSATTGSGAAAPPIAAPAGKKWQLGYSVEFDGTSLDTTKLSPCFDWNYGDCTASFNSGKERYLPSQVLVSGGVAYLVAQPLSPPYASGACFNSSCTYKSGLISTARPNQSSPYLYPFTYGYVETRMKLPRTSGMFTAFWMLPTDPTYQNYRNEIDIAEILGGRPQTVYQSYGYNNRTQAYHTNVNDNNGNCAVVDYSAGFHTYGVDWQADHIAYFIDGKECGRFTDASQIHNGPMQIIIDLMVDNYWQRSVNLVLPSQTVTDHLDVDYLRVWQAK